MKASKSRYIFGFYVFATVSLLYIIWTGSILSPVATKASLSDNMSGYAWSSNIGWISFNCTNTSASACDTTSDYGVHVDDTQKSTNGVGGFSGHAWSSNIGWISFDRSDTGNPPGAPFNSGSGPIAKIDWATGNVTGWARALAADGNGWDGWIKLSDDSNVKWANRGVSVNVTTGQFSGYAWGSDVVGWVSFNCADAADPDLCSKSNYKVSYGHINLLPVAPSFTVPGAYYGIQSSFSVVTYGATDPEGGPISITSLFGATEGNAVIIGATGVGYTNTSAVDGQDSFTYTVRDSDGAEDSGLITVLYGFCGDSIPNLPPEDCDGNDTLCKNVGLYTQGTATCNASCKWDTLSCLTQCGDGVDNEPEPDGKIDATDPGCWSNPTNSSTYSPNNTSEDNCGNGYCESSTGETRLTCPIDCKARIEEF